MTSFGPRDPSDDHLLTPQNAAVVIIDFQPVQVSSIASRPKRELVTNITALARIAKLYEMPVVLSTVNVATGRNQPTIHQITDVLIDVDPIDRTSINAWEDEDFNRTVKATGRRKLIMAALWTEVCLVHPALDAIHEGFEVYPVVDCVGGTSLEAHQAGLQRLVQASQTAILCRDAGGNQCQGRERGEDKAQLALAEAALEQNKVTLAGNEFVLNRQQILAGSNSASQAALDKARTDYDTAQAAVKAAEANVRLAQISLDYTEVKAPFDGRIERRLVDVGNLVGQSSSTKLATINRITPLYIYFSLSETNVVRVRAMHRSQGGARVAAEEISIEVDDHVVRVIGDTATLEQVVAGKSVPAAGVRRLVRNWRAIRNKTANSYIVEISI